MNKTYIQKCINLSEEEIEFIKEEKNKGNKFDLSKFVRFKLDEYIKARKEAELFMEQW